MNSSAFSSGFSRALTGKVCEVYYQFFKRSLFAMDFGSSFTLAGVATPIVVDIKDHPCPVFKQWPHIVKVNDSVDAFSRVPEGFLYVKDVRAYIHYTLENLGSFEIKNIYIGTLVNQDGSMKLEF